MKNLSVSKTGNSYQFTIPQIGKELRFPAPINQSFVLESITFLENRIKEVKKKAKNFGYDGMTVTTKNFIKLYSFKKN